ncbi:MAG TPA: CsgG/HfaB family protein [Gemmatimonadaceae bacterium]|nr:CsgG/HfaB family protein [Gemmatimonadaceae bacterium]
MMQRAYHLLRRGPAGLAAALALAACRPMPPGQIAPRRAAADSAARAAIANERAINPATLPAHTLGVAPFDVASSDTLIAPLAYGLADLLMTDLARSSQVQVVDRLRLDALLGELHLAASGRVDSATAPRVGKLVGARRLVVGNLAMRPGSQLMIEARVANAATQQIRQAVSASAPLDDILSAEKALAFRLFDQLGVTLSPAERAAVEQRPTKNISALLAYSRGVRFDVEGNYSAATREFQSALRLDPGFQQAGVRMRGAEAQTSPAPVSAVTRVGSLARATSTAVNGVNQISIAPVGGSQAGGPSDPAFPTQTVTILITITTPQ